MKTTDTHIVGIFGDPIVDSLSPDMHTAAFKALGLSWSYLPFRVPDHLLKPSVESIRLLNLRGVNVTMPLKETIIQYLDVIDDKAARIKSVNTVLNDNGVLKGFSTDGDGFIAALAQRGLSPAGSCVFVAGAGGAGRAVAYACAASGAKTVVMAARRPEKVTDFALRMRTILPEILIVPFGPQSESYIRDSDIVINTTPLGKNSIDDLQFLVDGLSSSAVACDLSTVPPLSAFLVAAQQRGCRVVTGLGMLVHQGSLSFKIWTGLDAPIDVMLRAVGDDQ